ncbi:SWIB/MDM2 domain superfamily protein [Perilla frutescens var. hirtella]|uniref:SWIB/MDM2 domain superfamily protein n=1 Tax=Perilla frutescens var. hirtella TaxID=608512 RepID=A0AAD4JII0_PERFH|nr:SWIB/MDM2 domain superfamily protein [Perilla frutescens var. hirtella]KAH6811802.1 SWIB/MDM2 domain superfamily protein [Perilla frutescens var. frutescens]KAH6834407.1 SWIB/MDM2 domain superfamily protein [Perilla frutescens var. hirtella]
MAVSSGVFSTFFVSQSASFVKSSPVSVKLVSTKLPLRVATITAAASKQATEAETKKREPRGIMKPRRVSPEMQEFLGGVAEIPRTQALKEIWAHIKQQNLQDPADKKVIICDEKLKKIFAGKDRVGFLEIAGLISPHFLK